MPDLTRISEPEAWLDFAGRIHPLLVHFPIALLIVAFVLEVIFGRRRSPGSVRSVLVVLTFGTFGAAAAAAAGWQLAEGLEASPARQEALDLHRWAGVATAGVALLAWLVGLMFRKAQTGSGVTTFRFLLLLAAGTVGVSGHLGAGLVWGDDYLLEPFAAEEPRDTVEADEPAPIEVEATPLPSASLAAAQELFAARCIDCHGPDRPKAGLRLDELDAVVGEEAGIVAPGDLEGSWLWTLVNLPEDDSDRMPEDDEPLTPDELAVLETWILDGAPTR